MDEIQIKRILACVENCYVCAADELNFYEKYPCFYIVNTARRSDPSGEHWISFILDQFDQYTICYFFDALAGFPEVICPQIFEFACQHSDIIYFNGRRVQDPINATCGLHSCYFVLSYQKEFNFNSFLQKFNKKESQNDFDVFQKFWKFLRSDLHNNKSENSMICKSIKASIAT